MGFHAEHNPFRTQILYSAVKKAWRDTFHSGMTEDQIIEQRSKALYNLIQAIHNFTEHLQITEEKAGKSPELLKVYLPLLILLRP